MSGLFGSTSLEVLIGLFLIYFLLSLICSHINELIAILLKWRAKDLENAMQNLLCDPEIAEKVRNHQLIKALGNTRGETFLVRAFAWLSERWSNLLSVLPIFKKKENAAGWPSYIPSRTFALALFDSLAPPGKDTAITVDRIRDRLVGIIQEVEEVKVLLGDKNQAPFQGPANFDNISAVVKTLVASVNDPAAPELPATENEIEGRSRLEDLRRSVAQLPKENHARQVALDFIDVTQHLNDPDGKTRKDVQDILDAKQALSRAILSLIDKTNYARKEAMDSGQLCARLGEIFDYIKDPVANEQAFRDQITKAVGFDGLRNTVQLLPDYNKARKIALDVIDTAQRDFDAALKTAQADLDSALNDVQVWFDDIMDRVSGVYKRRAQVWILFISLFVTVLIGIDTFRIFDSLTKDPAKRAALVATANNIINTGANVSTTPTNTAAPATTPAPDTTAVATTPLTPTGTLTTTASLTPTLTLIQTELNDLNQLGLPLGYGDAPKYDPVAYNGDKSKFNRDWISWLWKRLAGILVTTIAVSLGAPFWFEMLNKIANLRGAGNVPPKSEADGVDSEKKS